jgi:Lipase C-terminal domain/AF_1763-like, C-terminal domain/alpha/beta hydrolase fold
LTRKVKLHAIAVAAVVATALLGGLGSSARASHTGDVPLPIVFVHGGAGSGAQYESVARRFVSNGYPADRIRTFEYDSSSLAAIVAAPAGIDALVDQLRAQYDVARVNLVGHSLGTTVSGNYLANPARAAKIAHYVGVDGRSDATCGVGDPNLDCMGIFRGSTGDVGGNNVYFNGTQSHVEAETSPQSFAAQYQFFTGKAPETTLILPEPPGQVEIGGRVVNFPQNTGVNGATLRIWEVNPATGQRKDPDPVATIALGPSGAWGPVAVNGQQSYEFEIRRADMALVGHQYYQPFLRDDYWIRLLSLAPGSPSLVNTATGPNHSAAVVSRYREWWTTNPSGIKDGLEISTTSRSGNQPPVNVLQNVVSNGITVGASPTGIHVHDNPADQVSSLNLIPFFASQPFQTGVDVFMPATDPADGTITFTETPRGDTSRVQVLRTPNWPSSGHRILVFFNDYVQDINTWGECKSAKPSPCK